MSNEVDLFTSKEVAEQLRTSRTVIEREARKGRIGSVKVGRRRLYPRDAVAAYIDANRQGPRR